MHHIPFDKDNKEQQLAYDLIANTSRCLFITGKAGTGKTTFVKRIQEEIKKNFLVLAPTGIAAIAAGGQTIHSFFGFPMEVIGPHTTLRVSQYNEDLLHKIDTIIVDEASMLRSDMVDGMDRYLRIAFQNNMPFGGKQIIFVGDLFQLPPVLPNDKESKEMLHDLYGDGMPFFFKALALKRINLPKIEFVKVYRQKDRQFVDILNRMRVGETTLNDLSTINERAVTDKDLNDYTVTLTAYNKIADNINSSKLKMIDADEVEYIGQKDGNFRQSDCPAPESLRLKVGAQVIFCRNDYNAKCANGTIAKVLSLNENVIKVILENGNIVRVERTTWESYKRKYNRESQRIESEVAGSYTQFPLKLAWAISIHKSQGMTFERMHFDLSWSTFADGQAYVAISRMKSLVGLTLSKPLMMHHIKVNQEIKAYANSFNDGNLITDELESGKMISRYISKRDFDGAVKSTLDMAIYKIKSTDFRNAALRAKEMFDIMLDDECLLGKTSNMPIIKDYNVTCNFLNSVICLYGNRYDEAIGYADLVLSRRLCIEAMFVKARAYYELGDYQEASNVLFQIISSSNNGHEKRAIDKKLYLLEAKINDKLGNPNIALCKKLAKMCPNCMQAYIFIRNEMIRNNQQLLSDEETATTTLVSKFDDSTVENHVFYNALSESGISSNEFKTFKQLIFKLSA